MAKDKQLTDYTFEELVDNASRDVFDGLITGGGKDFKSRLWAHMNTAVRWRFEKDQQATKEKKTPANAFE